MKKAIVIIIFLSIFSSGWGCNAPTFENLLDAIEQVESGGKNAVGDGGKAFGAYQIHKIYVDDVNRISKKNYSYADRNCKKKSREMVTIYLKHYGKGKSLIDMARIHNGGPRGHKKKCTVKYGEKVKKALR